jgi:hypothetical protein
MDEIGQEPRHDLRLPPGPRRWLTGAGVVLLVAALAVYGARTILRAQATSAPPPAATPGTVLVTCGSAVFSHDPGWQAASLQVGTLWFVAGRSLGYVRVGRPAGAATSPTANAATPKGVVGAWVEMLVHVDPGAAVVMRAAVGTGSAFEFLGSPDPAGGFRGLDGARGYTFVPCPAADSGGGMTGFYDLGFSIVPGSTAAAEVWTSPAARPVWLMFSAPEPGTAP